MESGLLLTRCVEGKGLGVWVQVIKLGNSKKKIRKEGKNKNEQVIEAVEIEYIGVGVSEYERRICAMIKALLEIDDRLSANENEDQISKEAA